MSDQENNLSNLRLWFSRLPLSEAVGLWHGLGTIVEKAVIGHRFGLHGRPPIDDSGAIASITGLPSERTVLRVERWALSSMQKRIE